MKILRDMEQFFEKHIEGLFRKHFATGIQPVEVGKKLVRAMEENLQISVTKTYAPNHYIVDLNPQDQNRLQSLAVSLTAELAQYVARRAAEQGVIIAGELVVELRENANLVVGELQIAVGFRPISDNENEREQAQTEHHQGTQVFDGLKLGPDLPVRHKASPCAVLRVRSGIDLGRRWELGNNRMYIGRRQTNEIALNDMNASRVHAYIAMEEGRHVLHDAKSLNGTYVNEERVLRKLLCSGDCVKVGHTILVYEVM